MHPHLPKVYTASKFERQFMWHPIRAHFSSRINFVSSWLDTTGLQSNTDHCREGWIRNITDLSLADYLVVYGQKEDSLSGTIVEIGGALELGIPIFLIGDYPWNTWKHHPKVICAPFGNVVLTLENIIEVHK